MKDDRIRYVTAERRALKDHNVCALVITNAQLAATEMARRIVAALPAVAEIRSERSGPVLLALHTGRIDEIALD